MNPTRANILTLTLCWLVVTGLGVYLTFKLQPDEMDALDQRARAAELKREETTALIAQHAETAEAAQDVARRWNARYKIVPAALRSPDVVGYLNGLTDDGFKRFDLTVDGVSENPEYRAYTLSARGEAYYASLYRLVWELENNRRFYRVTNLTLDHLDLVAEDTQGRPRRQVMVSFSMQIQALFGGATGMSADESAGARDDVPPAVPDHVMPAIRPVGNPFFPLVAQALPPNTYGHVDIEEADLVSIADGRAIFRDGQGYRTLAEGDAVYLGRIVRIDPRTSSVTARLNRGGIVDDVTRALKGGSLLHTLLPPTPARSN
jgi:hypothetical protein